METAEEVALEQRRETLRPAAPEGWQTFWSDEVRMAFAYARHRMYFRRCSSRPTVATWLAGHRLSC